jgi:hypothetical protein
MTAKAAVSLSNTLSFENTVQFLYGALWPVQEWRNKTGSMSVAEGEEVTA